MNLQISYAFKIMGEGMYPAARQGGLSKIGHAVDEVDLILVVKDGRDRYVLFFGEEKDYTIVEKLLKKTIPDVEYLATPEEKQKAIDAHAKYREGKIDAILFFDREIYV